METDNKLRQAIKTYIDTFHEVKRLVELIIDLPTMQEEGLLRHGNNRVLQSWRLTTKDIESLYHRLTHSTLVEDINNGIVEDFPDDETISRRMKHLKFSLNQADVFKIEDINLAFGDNIPTTKILSEIMDYAEAYDYINTVWGIFREWNLIVDCLNKVVSEIESEFLTPQPDTSTKQGQRVEQNIILQREDIKQIFDKAVSSGLMKFEDGYYCWLKKSELLAYFCKQVSLKRDLAEKYSEKTGEPQTNWKAFSGVFKIVARQGKNKGCWSLQTGRQIEGFMKGYMKYYSRFTPNECELVDDLF